MEGDKTHTDLQSSFPNTPSSVVPLACTDAGEHTVSYEALTTAIEQNTEAINFHAYLKWQKAAALEEAIEGHEEILEDLEN